MDQDAFFPNLFDRYGSRPPNFNEIMFLRFCKKYMTTVQGDLIPQTKGTVILYFTS